MKDLIEKIKFDACCAIGAIWMHIDAQEERIAELIAERDKAEKNIISSTDAFKRIALAHLAALRASNGDAAEIARLAAYVEPQQGDLSAAILALPLPAPSNLPYGPCYSGGDMMTLLQSAADLVAASQHKAGVQTPEGWQLVPKISTSVMDRAGEDAYESRGHCDCGNAHGTSMEAVFSAMLAVAPLPPAPQPAQQEGE